MSFQFRYQRILDVRELEEDQEQAEFVEIQNRLREEERKLNDLRQQLQDLFDQKREYKRGSARDLQRFKKYAQTLNNRIEEQMEVVEEWEEKLDAQRQELIDASQKRRVLERLREQDLDEFREDVREAEQREQEDVANQQYHLNDDRDR